MKKERKMQTLLLLLPATVLLLTCVLFYGKVCANAKRNQFYSCVFFLSRANHAIETYKAATGKFPRILPYAIIGGPGGDPCFTECYDAINHPLEQSAIDSFYAANISSNSNGVSVVSMCRNHDLVLYTKNGENHIVSKRYQPLKKYMIEKQQLDTILGDQRIVWQPCSTNAYSEIKDWSFEKAFEYANGRTD